MWKIKISFTFIFSFIQGCSRSQERKCCIWTGKGCTVGCCSFYFWFFIPTSFRWKKLAIFVSFNCAELCVKCRLGGHSHSKLWLRASLEYLNWTDNHKSRLVLVNASPVHLRTILLGVSMFCFAIIMDRSFNSMIFAPQSRLIHFG